MFIGIIFAIFDMFCKAFSSSIMCLVKVE